MDSFKRRDLVELIALGAIWGASFLFMRVAVPEFGALPLVAVRVTAGALALLPLLLLRGGFAPLRGRWGRLAILSLATQTAPFVLFTYAAAHQPAGLSAILNATVPFFGALIGALAFGTRLQPRALAGVACGFGGVVLLILTRGNTAAGFQASFYPVLACLLASSCYGFAAHFARRNFAGVDPLATTTGSQLLAIGFMAPAALAFAPAANPSALAWACVVALGVLGTALAYVIYYRLIRNAGPSFAMSVTYLVPMFGVLWSAIFLHEPVTAGMLLAGAVILAGVALTVRA